MITAVTGASGHIGACLVRKMLDQGRKVRVLVRKDTRGLEGLDVEQFQGDMTSPDSLLPLLDGVDVVHHLAGFISVDGSNHPDLTSVNIGGVTNLMAAALKSKVRRVVHYSSIHALVEHPLNQPLDETRSLMSDPQELPYNLSKAGGERQVAKAVEQGLDVVVVNPSGVIGPFDFKLSHMGEVINDLAQGRMPALIAAGYNFVDVRDVVDGALAAEVKGRTGERYLLCGNFVTFGELAASVATHSGTPAPRFTVPMWVARMGAPFSLAWAKITGQRPKYTSASLRVLRGNGQVDLSKASGELGYAPRPLDDTIRDAIAWQRENGFLTAKSMDAAT
jgi:dihydroflavonol-4-reductase